MSDVSFVSILWSFLLFRWYFLLHGTQTDQSVNEADSDDLVGLLPEMFTSTDCSLTPADDSSLHSMRTKCA